MFPSFSSKEIDALSEAYASVYEAAEAEKETEKEGKESGKDEGGKHKEGKHPKGKEEKGEKVTEKEMKESFDIILSHLLSDGYADSAESATAIMANMSEEWRDSILEAQRARENPEKYEREENKKYEKVRGESRPMPPRGNKDREAFEKWYASQGR
jgi:hypothetical protein